MAKAKRKSNTPRKGAGLVKDSGAAVTEAEVRKALSNLSAKTIAEIAGAVTGGPALKAGKMLAKQAGKGVRKPRLGTQRASSLRRLGRMQRGNSKK